jgi:hypothetical protein
MTQHANHHTVRHELAQHSARFSVADSRRDGYAQPQSSHPLRSVAPVGSDPRGFFVSPPAWGLGSALIVARERHRADVESRVPPPRCALQEDAANTPRDTWVGATLRGIASMELGQCDGAAAYEGSRVIERTASKGAP